MDGIITTLFAPFETRLQGLKERIKELIPIKIAEIKAVRAEHGEKVLGTCTINQAYMGMRSVKAMVTETSELDVMEVCLCAICLPPASRRGGGSQPW